MLSAGRKQRARALMALEESNGRLRIARDSERNAELLSCRLRDAKKKNHFGDMIVALIKGGER